MSSQERHSADEFQQLRSELQPIVEEKQASMIQDMREMMAELMRNSDPSVFSSAEGSATVRGSSTEDSAAVRGRPRGAEPTAARQTSAAAVAAAADAAGGGARGDTCTTAARGAFLREDTSRKFGVTRRRRAAFSVEVDPTRGQPDQPRGAGEWGTYPSGELGIGYDMPSPRLTLKHTAVPYVSEKKPSSLPGPETPGTTQKQ